MSEKNVIFEEYSQNGKRKPWKEKKLENIKYAEYLEILNFKKANNVKDCGNVIEFKNTKNGLKIYRAYFCKSRLCPLCAWRKSYKQSGELARTLALANEQEQNARFLFLTLTVKNVDGDQLKQTLRELSKGFNFLTRYKNIKKNLLGYVRTTEITVNKTYGTYHPHLHVLLMVKPDYFTRGNYLSHDDYQNLWQKALRTDERVIVNIKKVYDRKKSNKYEVTHEELLNSAIETSKYQVKSSDYLTKSKQKNLKIIDDLEHALDHARQISYGGLLKQIHKDIREQINNDLTDNISKNELEKAESILVKWNNIKKNYYIS